MANLLGMTRECLRHVTVLLLVLALTAGRRFVDHYDGSPRSLTLMVRIRSSSRPTGRIPYTASTRNETDAVKLIEDLTNKSDSRVRPGVYGPATEVKIDFFVRSFGPLHETEMEFQVDLDFRQTWRDPRMSFNSTDPDLPVYIPHHNIDNFWIPDVYFPNEKSGTTHVITLPNKSIRIYPNGTVRYFSRMAMRVSCTMYLAKFPLDHQKCQLKISTYSYDEKQVKLFWYDAKPVELHTEKLNLPQFDILDVESGHCNESYKTGKYSCLTAIFMLRRKVGFFVLQTYVPSILIVMLSWVGFWINKNSEPARIALGVTTVLTMTTQLTSSASNTMRVSYPKAIDVWYSACMLFVFGALIEFAFVNVYMRSEKKPNGKDIPDVEMQKAKLKDHEETIGLRSNNDEDCTESPTMRRGPPVSSWPSAFRKICRWALTSKNIDKLSRRVFPICFFVFNVCYWLTYTVFMSDQLP